ncbi:non-structural maintenance of chromosomes element 4 homolog A-like [Dysidea avara]|uniref:non-structural maintenance of chromosomes element 4 homolog A-like n=1 Tax=Dysidea avara TaxID=196820 RepID=UPI003334A425
MSGEASGSSQRPTAVNEDAKQLQREKYRQLHSDTEKKREDLISPGNQGLRDVLRNANDVVAQVIGTREAALDAQVISLVSDLGDEQLRNIKTDIITFDPRVFNQKILTMLGGRESEDLERLDWSRLGSKVCKTFRSAPTVDFLYGGLEIEPMKQRVQRQRQKREPIGEAKKPREIKQVEEEEEATTKDVSHLLTELRKACNESGDNFVHFFEFLAHPTSFSQTVENIFHFSFLIKEGRAGVQVLDDQPYIFLPKNVDQAGQAQRPSTNQCIISLDMDSWKKITETYELLPFKPRVEQKAPP